MKTYEIIITICNCLSLFGACVIFSLFTKYSKLRAGFFSHIIIYITIGSVVQILGIQLSASYNITNCTLSVSIIICGSLIMIFWSTLMIWSIRKLFIVYSERGTLEDLESMHDSMRNNELKFVISSFTLPILLGIWPALLKDSTSEQVTNNFCYLYTNSLESKSVFIQVSVAKLISWEVPIIFYLSYSIVTLLQDIDEVLFKEIKKLVKKLLAFPIITIFTTFLFTVMDLETFFNVQIGEIQSTISWSFLSLWGFFNFFAYIAQSNVREELLKNDNLEQELNPMIQNDQLYEETISDKDYFYGASQIQTEQQQIQIT